MNHETAYRGNKLIDKFKATKIFICGAGALGANLAETLARIGFDSLGIIDFDTVSDTNIATQPYSYMDVGKSKVMTLTSNFYKNLGTKLTYFNERLTENNVHLIKNFNPNIVVDCFDNSVSRQLVYDYTRKNKISCLHGGMADNFGEVKWNNSYIVPKPSKLEDVCDYPLTRNLIMLTVALLSESIINFVDCGKEKNYHINVSDMSIKEV